MSSATQPSTDIRPFHIDSPDEKVDDLRRRIGATRWPSKELVRDRSQGVQLEAARALARYWLDEYDFGRVEARLNALPQFVTEIDGVDVHFIHAKSSHEDALPLIMTHGWPGSVIELIDTVGPLTDPTAHGAAPTTPSTSNLTGYHRAGRLANRRRRTDEPVRVGQSLLAFRDFLDIYRETRYDR